MWVLGFIVVFLVNFGEFLELGFFIFLFLDLEFVNLYRDLWYVFLEDLKMLCLFWCFVNFGEFWIVGLVLFLMGVFIGVGVIVEFIFCFEVFVILGWVWYFEYEDDLLVLIFGEICKVEFKGCWIGVRRIMYLFKWWFFNGVCFFDLWEVDFGVIFLIFERLFVFCFFGVFIKFFCIILFE